MTKRITITIRGPKHAPTVEALGVEDSGFGKAMLEPRPHEDRFTDKPNMLREDLGSVSMRAEETFRPQCPAFVAGKCALTAISYLGEGPAPADEGALFMTLRCLASKRNPGSCPSLEDGMIVEAIHISEEPITA